jgi:hypothetical protein
MTGPVTLEIVQFGHFSFVLNNFYFVYDNFCKSTPISRFLPGKYFVLARSSGLLILVQMGSGVLGRVGLQ